MQGQTTDKHRTDNRQTPDSIITYKSLMSPIPVEARPGSTKPPKEQLVYQPYTPEQQIASTTDRPVVGRQNRPIGEQENVHREGC